MFSELILTDGTTKIDLLGGNKNGAGFSLIRYVPGRPNFKGGGVWQDSPLAEGRQLVGGTKTNYADALTLRIAYPSHDSIITALNDFDEMIEKAIAYWTTTWQQEPVYVQAQTQGETEKRYALVYMIQFDNYFDPYAQPYISAGMHTTEELVVGIERGPWLEFVPGESEPVDISTAGMAALSTDPEYDDLTSILGMVIGNMRNDGLKAIYRFTGSFSSNLLAGSAPYTVSATPPVTGDIAYFGADQPFYGLVTDFSTLPDASTWVFEYWNGSAWTTLTTLFSGPLADSSTGIATQRWLPANVSTWAKTSINSESRYWIRWRVTSGGGTTTYTQSNRHIYSTTNPYIEVDAGEIAGTLDALVRYYLQRYNVDTTTNIEVWAGLRSYERGANFAAYINCGDTAPGNPSGVTWGSTAGGTNGHANGIVAATSPLAPGGETYSLTGAVGDTLGIPLFVLFGGTSYRHFYGRFRLFVLLNTTDDTGASRLRYSITNYTGVAEYVKGEIKNVATSPTSYQLVDLGNVTLPAADTLLQTEDTYGFRLNIEALITNTKTLTFLSVILIPADESMLQVSGRIPSVTADSLSVIHVDGIGYPKYKVRAFSMEGDPYVVTSGPLTVSSSEPPILHAGTRQRWWFLFRDANVASPAIATSVKMHKCQRYKALRND